MPDLIFLSVCVYCYTSAMALKKKMKRLLHLFYQLSQLFIYQYRYTTRNRNRFGSPITPDASLLFFSASDL